MQQEATQFEILDRIDVGGMAEIFRAKNLGNGQIMAIKRILPTLARQTNFVSMFIDEAAVCMMLNHPNIVRVDQIGLMDDALFLSMELVDGINLRELLNFSNQYQFRLPVHEAVRIAALVLDGLAYAHKLCNDKGEPLNLIHRDVSPPNILLGYNGDVKITDFGLVKSKTQVSKTVPGLIKGKFSYLSPEAAYGESIDARSDIYAVGIILWEMLTAQPLFNDPVEMKILDLVRKSIVPPIAPLNPDVPPALESIIMKGLARSRTDRYATADEFAKDLRDFLTSIGNPASTLGDIVTKIKPPAHKDEPGNSGIPSGASASDDELKPHTQSTLIPFDKLRKAADAESASQESVQNSEDTGVNTEDSSNEAGMSAKASGDELKDALAEPAAKADTAVSQVAERHDTVELSKSSSSAKKIALIAVIAVIIVIALVMVFK